MDRTQLDAPIVSVTVYPDRARVTRRGAVRLSAGEHRIRIGPLPYGLRRDSVRVGGGGPATVLGVDVVTHHQPRSTDPTAARLEDERRELAAELAELADLDAVEGQRSEFLSLLAQRAGGSYARALAAGERSPDEVTGFVDSMVGQLTAARTRQRELAQRRDEARDRLTAIERGLKALPGKRQPDQLAAEVTVDVGADRAEIQLELSYVVSGADWRSSYDLRLVDATLTLTWFGLVKQQTGEDWPECELLLSTARPSAAVSVPELTPWYLDRVRPLPPPAPEVSWGGPIPAGVRPGSAPGGGSPPRMRAMQVDAASAPVREGVAEVEQGVAAATYRPARPVAVPADGGLHRATVAVLDLATTLDHITAPVLAAEAHLRATVVNSSTHTLLPGVASVFHGGDFVGSTPLPVWAPGEEVELALGLDDRVRVDRELVRRSDTKATLGSTRRRELEYRISVANHTPGPARVTVLDQLPVSRDEGITARELRLEPAPDQRTELGQLTWRLDLPAGGSREILTGLRVDLAKGVELTGWRE